MIYFDYSATTKVSNEVLKRFNEVVDKYYFNPNSNYDLSLETHQLIENDTKDILNYFNVPNWNLIYTSGASESNNTIIKGFIDKRKEKTIITTKLEHSSIITPVGYLQRKGYNVQFVNLNADGTVDLNHLKSLINDDTLLVTIGYVNSELGILEPINEIGKIIHEINSNTIFHTDMTQAVGKVSVDLSNVDCASFSGHKIHTFKGIGGLLLKPELNITPLIHGGKSTTLFRSGTPQTELIDSLATAIKNIKLDEEYVNDLNKLLVAGLLKYSNIRINSTNKSIPQIINFSILAIPSNKTQEYFANKGIYFSTKTACSSETSHSLAVYTITNDMDCATTSLRISISNLSTREEVETFLKVLAEYEGEISENSIN